jgi:dTDP-4-dehydrorhamnose 3,5-epimerase
MIFTPTNLPGAFVIDLERREDHRGFFARTFCAQEFAAQGLNPAFVQGSFSSSFRKGTLRGMHYQTAPFTEVKLVRCTAGAIFDVIVDVRPDSPTYLKHFGIELSARNGRALYVPEMFAHGCLTLTDDTEVAYQMSQYHGPGCDRGLRYDDPALAIPWPAAATVLSERDAHWPLLEAAARDEVEAR